MKREDEVSGGKRRPLVLVADDDGDLRTFLAMMLKPRYETRLAKNGAEAVQAALQEPFPELVLLDVMMPDLDGYEVCKRLKANPATADIPVVFVTSKTDPKAETDALLLGAVDFIVKPITAPRFLLRIATHLALRDRRRELEQMVADRTAQLVRMRVQLIRRLARAMELRYGGLTHRVARVSQYVKLVAAAYGLAPADCELLSGAAPLYDIGKLGIPEAILQKTAALSEAEWTEVRKHPRIGADIIGKHDDPLLAAARVMALSHHERWDGTGYPARLAGEAIPLAGRIMALADAFEAMTTTQRHREPLTLEEAANAIVREAGKQFDPRVVAAFRKVVKRMVTIHRAVPDELEGIHDLDFAVPATPEQQEQSGEPQMKAQAA